MPRKLTLIAETKLHKLLPGCNKKSRLEASGVVLTAPDTCYVVCDNTTTVARLNPSLEPDARNTRIDAVSPSKGFESITWDPESERFFLLAEALKDTDGQHRGFVVEYDRNFLLQRCTRLDKPFRDPNKGFEGLAHHRHHGRECLWALCEGNLCRRLSKGGGRIQVFTRTAEQNWRYDEQLKLPASAEFEDYSAIAIHHGKVAVVSQQSQRIWVGNLDDTGHNFDESGAIYRFPGKGYCNVEGAAWLSPTRLLTVSDRRKKGAQPKSCSAKHQSVHIFEL